MSDATNVGSIVAKITGDDSNLLSVFERDKAAAEELARTSPTLTIKGDNDQAMAAIDEVEAREASLGDKNVNISATTSSAGSADAIASRNALSDADIRLMSTEDALAAVSANTMAQLDAQLAGFDAAVESAVQSMFSEVDAAAEVELQQLQTAAAGWTLWDQTNGLTVAESSLAAATRDAAAAEDEKSASDAVSVGRTGLMAAGITALITTIAPLTADLVGVGGAFGGMASAGVLAVIGIKNEMDEGTAVGQSYSAGLQSLKGDLDSLSNTAAVNMLSSFDTAQTSISESLPELNAQIGVFSTELGTAGDEALQGVITGMQVANPLFQEGAQVIGNVAEGFNQWTADGGLQKFVTFAENALPVVVNDIGNVAKGAVDLVADIAPVGGVVLNAAGAVGQFVSWLTSLGPVLPIVAAGGLAAYGAFQLWGTVPTILEAVGTGITAVGTAMDFLATPTAAQAAAMAAQATSTAAFTGVLGGEATALEAATVAEGDAAAGATALGAAVDFAEGPIGIVMAALGGLAAAIGVTVVATQQNTAATTDYSSALEQDNAAIGENTTKLVAQTLQHSDVTKTASSLGISLTQMTEAVTGNSTAWDAVTKKISDAKEQTKEQSAEATSGAGSLALQGGALDALSKYLDTSKTKLDDQQKSVAAAKAATDASTSSTQSAASALQQENSQLDALSQKLSALGQSQLSTDQANIQFRASIDAAAASVSANGQGLDENTAKGRANAQALDGIATSAIALIAAQAKTGAGAAVLSGNMETARESFVAAAIAAGDNAQQANDLADKYGLIPKNVDTIINADASGAQKGAKNAQDAIDGVKGKTVNIDIIQTITTLGTPDPKAPLASNIGKAHGGTIARLATGGNPLLAGGTPVGAGSSFSDLIGTYLSPQEEVTNAASASYPGVRNLLKSLNANPSGTMQVLANPPRPSSPSLKGVTIQGQLDLGNGLIGTIRAVVTDELAAEARVAAAGSSGVL